MNQDDDITTRRMLRHVLAQEACILLGAGSGATLALGVTSTAVWLLGGLVTGAAGVGVMDVLMRCMVGSALLCAVVAVCAMVWTTAVHALELRASRRSGAHRPWVEVHLCLADEGGRREVNGSAVRWNGDVVPLGATDYPPVVVAVETLVSRSGGADQVVEDESGVLVDSCLGDPVWEGAVVAAARLLAVTEVEAEANEAVSRAALGLEVGL